MIPKKIHYCWFGRGDKPKLAKKCIDSWRKFCPDYEIVEWNEDNFDVNMNAYTKMCYEQKKYAFLTDYTRLVVVNGYGGIYFDTDVELVRPIDDLLMHKAFFGYETNEYFNTGEGFGSEAGTEVLKMLLEEYKPILSGTEGTVGCPILNTYALKKYGFNNDGMYQEINGVAVYPAEYFNPYDDPTGILRKTDKTYSIHWYGKSWLDKKKVIRSKIMKPVHRIFGVDVFHGKK